MKVVVLMSTWQGARFVEEQLRSILDQLPAEGRVIVRDDGSTDDGLARMNALGDARLSVVGDMCKAVGRGMTINDVTLLEKHGGKSGSYLAQCVNR